MYIVQKEMLTYPPRYYATKFHVSTWNYATVHCHAKIKYTDEKNEIWSKFVEMVPYMRDQDILQANNGGQEVIR